MQKLSTIKINLFIKGFQGVSIEVAQSKLGNFTAIHEQQNGRKANPREAPFHIKKYKALNIF